MALCPQCEAQLQVEAPACPRCHADFTAPDGWRPFPVDDEERAKFASRFGSRQTFPPSSGAAGESWAGVFTLTFIALCAGAGYGIFAHQLFQAFFSSVDGKHSGLMLASFLGGVPVLVGAIAVMLTPRRLRPAGSIVTSVLPLLFFVFIAGAFLREGMICILMALPIFLVLAGIGGLLSMMVKAVAGDKGPKLLGVAAFAPFLLATGEAELEPPVRTGEVRASVHILAPPATVWRHIEFPLAIDPAELRPGWAYRMGVPYPVEARTIEPRLGGKRELVWQRGVRFQEEITRYEPERVIAWRYLFDERSFPPGSLDEHIVLGGRYFDLGETSYVLTPEAGGTRLDIVVAYRVSTTFNWYADAWARFLLEDTAQAILGFYRRRSERT
ncbi:MAG TPA: SRPBCC family protein [Ramlibacter sp.]|jgi:uncharacterized protein YndB with AHSA1/START domain